MTNPSSRHLVDPELVDALDQVPTMALGLDTLHLVRGPGPYDQGQPDDGLPVTVERTVAPGGAGDPDVPLLIWLCCKDWRQSEVGCRSAPIRRLLRNGG